MIDAILRFLGRRLALFLTDPVRGYEPKTTFDLDLLTRCLRPADVLLVDGNTRVAVAIKYLTQSTWSHAALYVGPIADRCESSGEPHVLIEADVRQGVISAPLSKYGHSHTRICRPIGLGKAARRCVVEYAVSRIGIEYDVKNVVDLLRYLLPTPPVPVRFRRRLIAFGSGSPTRAICSTLIAQAFQSVRYPILPSVELFDDAVSPGSGEQARREILHIRHHSLFTPHDFDMSPYFAIVKPTIETGFDYRSVQWGSNDRMPNTCQSSELENLSKTHSTIEKNGLHSIISMGVLSLAGGLALILRTWQSPLSPFSAFSNDARPSDLSLEANRIGCRGAAATACKSEQISVR